MIFSHNIFAKAAVMATVLASAVIMVGCGSDDTRDAASVAASSGGTIVTGTSTDLGSIVIGWGEQYSEREITTPTPEEVTARCTGRGEGLAVDITAPHGWKIHANHGSQILTIGNVDQDLPATDIDTANQFLEVLGSVDWSETDQFDIAATTDAPEAWNPAHSGRVQLSIHIDCR
ncbi:hypothetical protein [Rhodococcus globerulus]|uniref:hypothetical protein n=1 Tax=Rhodococcus globerulus TaxID=33008 RepID=UPI001F28AD6A|nr:hypothetical protein [Rhodococcus globerulus]MCE4267220.1 hypothetical protein [Rhodococcus globerulus]